MFRFTIRDVLWLTLMAALGIGWWLNGRDRNDLLVKISVSESKISDLEDAAKSQERERDSMVIALAEELEKAIGRKLSGWSSVPDPQNPGKRILTLRFAEPPPQN